MTDATEDVGRRAPRPSLSDSMPPSELCDPFGEEEPSLLAFLARAQEGRSRTPHTLPLRSNPSYGRPTG